MGTEPLTLDVVFRVLSDERRRRVLLYLLDRNPRDGPAALVPEDVWEGDADLTELQLSLAHVHLPMLERVGLVRWDRQARSIASGPRFDEIRPFLEDVKE